MQQMIDELAELKTVIRKGDLPPEEAQSCLSRIFMGHLNWSPDAEQYGKKIDNEVELIRFTLPSDAQTPAIEAVIDKAIVKLSQYDG